METLLEGMAEYYSAELSEKVIRGQTENALKGKCTGGTGSIGYKIDEDKFYHLDPLTAPQRLCGSAAGYHGLRQQQRHMMPFIALLSTILIGWVMTPDYVIDEMQRNGETFRRKKLYQVMIRYVAPVMMLVLFLQSTGILA